MMYKPERGAVTPLPWHAPSTYTDTSTTTNTDTVTTLTSDTSHTTSDTSDIFDICRSYITYNQLLV